MEDANNNNNNSGNVRTAADRVFWDMLVIRSNVKHFLYGDRYLPRNELREKILDFLCYLIYYVQRGVMVVTQNLLNFLNWLFSFTRVC